MAELIPERLPARVTSSERRLYRALAGLPADCLVYFEPVVANRYPDFIVIAPSLGVLTIELKGWRAEDIVGADSQAVLLRESSRIGGVDTVTRRTHPVRQARDYMFRLMDRCREHRYAKSLLQPGGSHQGAFCFLFTRSKVYHHPGHRWYGGTQQGKYISEAEAIAEGDRAAQNERKPLNFGAAAVPLREPPQPTPRQALTADPLVRASPPILLNSPLPAPLAGDVGPRPDPSTESAKENPSVAVPKEQLSVCVQAIAAQSDPAKLATLGERGANPRFKRIMYYLEQARAGGADPGEVIDQAQRQNNSFGTPRASLVKASLLRNLKICDGLGLLTPENMAGLRRGNAPTVTRGPYVGQTAEVDHIVPLARARGIGNELANLEMLPASLNRAKSDKVGERQLALAGKLHDADLLSDAQFAQVQARFRPAGTQKYELQ